jgi:FAD:protein FMN transferase
MISETVRAFGFRAMNTDIEAVFRGGESQVEEAGALVRDWFRDTEMRFSRFLPDSELSRLNHSAGRTCLVSGAMLEVLLLAESWREATGGAFNPLVLGALESAGYDRSFERIGPGVSAVRPVPPPVSEVTAEIAVDAAMKSVRIPAGRGIDLGGIVKGWTVQRLADWLRSRLRLSGGMINAGGDLAAWDDTGQTGGALPVGWEVAVQNPWRVLEDICKLFVSRGAIATSGIGGRSWNTDRGPAHHLIDPRTMRPAVSDVLQCTVYGGDLIACEIWAKTVCILGTRRGLALLEEKGRDVAAIAFTKEGEGIRSAKGTMRRSEIRLVWEAGCRFDEFPAGKGKR